MIPKDSAAAMRKLADQVIRKEAGVLENNIFLFASTQITESLYKSFMEQFGGYVQGNRSKFNARFVQFIICKSAESSFEELIVRPTVPLN